MIQRLGFPMLLLIALVALMALFLVEQPGFSQEPSIKALQKPAEALSEKDADAGPPSEIKFDREDLIYDLGTIPQNSSGKAEIKFKNVGKGVLKIESVKPG